MRTPYTGKRLLDIVFSAIFLVVFFPAYLLVPAIIRLCSPGPAIYKSSRVGYGGRTFTMYKYRSMKINSRPVEPITLEEDERIFPFGRWIRKTKLDEFPQMINVLRGEMSVIGPRPESVDVADEAYREKYAELFTVKPGLSSPGSLYDYACGEKAGSVERYLNESMNRKMALEAYYVAHASLGYDLRLILRTAGRILLTVLGDQPRRLPEETLIPGRPEMRA